MKKIALLALAATAALCAPVAQARVAANGETQLARLLEGRVAGRPVDCISQFQTREARIIDGTAIVYDAGSVIYVNRPSGAEQLNRSDIMVTRLHTSQLCSVDTVRLHDPSGGWFSGFVGLNKFVPYRKVADAR